MQSRHSDSQQYFREQGQATQKYVIPYIEHCFPITAQTRVLEIGCGEAGNMVPFLQRGCEVTGVDLSSRLIANANTFMADLFPEASFRFICSDIYQLSQTDLGTFDLIVLRDVIEHIYDQKRFLGHVKQFMKPSGRIFFGFPPWQMPFGGHQQVCQSPILSKTPYFHLLPAGIYAGIMRFFGEAESTIEGMLHTKATGISIEQFRRFIREQDFVLERWDDYLINPNYEIKFGLKPRKQFALISAIPYLRNFLTTCSYCILRLP